VTRELEHLEEALQEAEAVARWHAERSVTAAAAFAGEIDAAEAAIVRLPEAWPSFDQSALANPRLRPTTGTDATRRFDRAVSAACG